MSGLTPVEAQALAATIADPVAFTRGVFGDDLWSKQEEILRALTAPSARVAVKACHASGKTRCAARAALWFLTAFDDGIVVTTAPTWPQVEKLLWGEIHAALHRARIQYPPANTTELKLGPSNYALGLSTNEGVRFQGFHAHHMLFILDEAPGVRPDIWEAIEGARAGGDVRILALGNPTIVGGPFYDAFSDQAVGWKAITISAFDTPNFDGVGEPGWDWQRRLEALLALDADARQVGSRPYLTTRAWVAEKWEEWGRFGHPLWDARVLGAFPAQDESALIALSWVERAKVRELPGIDPHQPLVAGIDVAGPGEDETVVAITQGPTLIDLAAWQAADARGPVAAFLQTYRDRLGSVHVDADGMGHYFLKHLADLEYRVVGVNVGREPIDKARFKNLKAELYWNLRERFQEGTIAGTFDETAAKQLTTIRWEHDSRGRVVIESKEDARKRGVKSPDRAEAIMLAFAPLGTGIVLGSQQARREPLRVPRGGMP